MGWLQTRDRGKNEVDEDEGKLGNRCRDRRNEAKIISKMGKRTVGNGDKVVTRRKRKDDKRKAEKRGTKWRTYEEEKQAGLERRALRE